MRVKAHGRSYEINDPGGLMGKAIREGGAYERKVLEHIQRKRLRGRAIDVGASVGNHTLWLAAICGFTVEAFEPLDTARLVANVALNPTLPITVHGCALGAEESRAPVKGPPSHVAGASFPTDGKAVIHTLDGYGFDDVALIKIDVEGMEPAVLWGAEETIATWQPVIFAEAESPAAHDRNAAILDDYGYEHVATFGATPLEEWQPR